MNGNYNQMQMQQPMGMNPMGMQQMGMGMNPMGMQPMQSMQPMMPQITGPTSGTSIADLRTDINPRILNQPQRQQPQRRSRDIEETQETDGPNMELLVKDLNRDLDEYAPSRRDSDDSERTNTDTDREESTTKSKWYKGLIPEFTKEIFLLLFVYILFSQGFIKKAIGNHITYINPNSDGNVSFFGVAIYGLILSIVYMIFKKIIIG